MVQQPRTSEPRYSCIVPVNSLTGHPDEEVMAFGVSAEAARNQAEQLLRTQYGCSPESVLTLMQQARLEPLAQWCSPSSHPPA